MHGLHNQKIKFTKYLTNITRDKWENKFIHKDTIEDCN